MNSVKRQKDMILKYALPRSVGAPYASGEEWRNNSRKSEETEPKRKHHSVVDVPGDGSKIRCCKEQSPWKKSHDQLRQHIKKQRHYPADKGPSSQSCGFSSSHV